jgi:hypothetical protein
LVFYGSSITVTNIEKEVANIKMNWKGHVVITFDDGPEYVLKAKGAFQNKYVIENKDGEKLIQFNPKFNWGKFNYNYDITHNDKPVDSLFILLGVYTSNYYIAVRSGAIACTA